MFYFKLTQEIKDLIQLIPDITSRKYQIGCKSFCKSQIIALDDLEMLKKILIMEKIKEISPEEFTNIKKSTESAYFLNTHTCSETSNKTNHTQKVNKTVDEEREEILKTLQTDKKAVRNEKFIFNSDVNYNDVSLKEKQEDLFTKTAKPVNKFNTTSYGFSMIFSFFLLVMGSYYLGKYFLLLSDSNTLKLTLVVTIIVFLAESFLLVMKLNKDNYFESKKMSKNSFAYKFNKNYRAKMDYNIDNGKSKVHNKTKVD